MQLMKESIERSYRIETEKGGLIIKKALFGNLDSQDPDEVIQVAQQMQSLVKDSRIVIPANTQLVSLLYFLI